MPARSNETPSQAAILRNLQLILPPQLVESNRRSVKAPSNHCNAPELCSILFLAEVDRESDAPRSGVAIDFVLFTVLAIERSQHQALVFRMPIIDLVRCAWRQHTRKVDTNSAYSGLSLLSLVVGRSPIRIEKQSE